WKELVREVANRIVCGTGGEGLFQRTREAPSARTFPGVADRGLQTTQLTGESQRLTHRIRGRLLVADQGAVHAGHPGAQRAERDDDADVLERFADRTRIVKVAAGAHDQDGFHRTPRGRRRGDEAEREIAGREVEAALVVIRPLNTLGRR